MKCISEIARNSKFFFILILAMAASTCAYSQTLPDSSMTVTMPPVAVTDSLQAKDTVVKISTDSTFSETKDSVGNKIKQNVNHLKESAGATADSISGKAKQAMQDTRQAANAAKDSLSGQMKNKVKEQKQALNAKKDSLASGLRQKAEDQKAALKSKKDSLSGKTKQMVITHLNTAKKQILSTRPEGTIAAGYEYGVLPYVADNNFPAGGFKAEGNISVFVLKIPVEFTFCYSTFRQVIGLNNYFRLSYDTDRYKEQLTERLDTKEQLLQNQLGRLKLNQQVLSQKIMFMNYLQKHPDYKIPARDLKNKKLPSLPKKDSLSFTDSLKRQQDSIAELVVVSSFPAAQADSMRYYSCPFDPVEDLACSFPVEAVDSVRYSFPRKVHVHEPYGYYMQRPEDLKSARDAAALRNKAERFDIPDQPDSAAFMNTARKSYAEKKDSISGELSAYTAQYDSINMAIEEIQTEIARIKAYKKMPDIPNNPYLSKVQQFLNHVKKLEIGLCYPSNSVFLLNNVPLQGLNFEYAKNNRFISVAYGTTMNNMFYNPHTLEGMLQGARNYYNYFDFGNLEAGRKIIAVKGGVGSKDNTHLYAGFLIGKGKTDYLLPVADPASLSEETNMVVELDGKYKFSSALSAELSIGKSSVQEDDLSMEQLKKCVNEIFSGYRSYALLTRVNASVKATGTRLTFTTRWIDPYFKSFGLGFLRSDNLRFEIKADQTVTSKIKYSMALRKEEDNLLKLYDYKNTLYSISNSLNVKLTRKLNIRLMYTPLFRTLRTGSETVHDRNTITTAVLTWMPVSKKINSQFNILYSRYLISGDSSDIDFENFSYSNQLFFRSGFKTEMNVSWFKNNLTDTTGNDTYLGVAGIGYTTKWHSSITLAGKIAYKAGIEPQYGFAVKASFRLYKNLNWESEAEKIIIGDYYNSFDISAIQKFPYLCKTRLVLNF